MTERPLESTGKVAVAMSGGVDSSVAALLLKQQGRDIIGISMQVWDYRGNGGCKSRATCCAPSDFSDARRVAARIGAPYYVFDFEHTFKREVIDEFVKAYERGMTPNPCVECNNKVKFRELRQRVLALGFAHVATGHYARIGRSADGYHLMRGRDLDKDQSYFLYGLKQEELASTLFPVGELTKAEVRELAREAELVTAEKPESQDICFVSGSVQDFLVRLGSARKRGAIVTANGTVVGEHDGVQNFTVGQRRGLAVGGQEDPLYVIELDPVRNLVVVGSRDELQRDGFAALDCSWVDPQILSRLSDTQGASVRIEAVAQLRHRHKGVPVVLDIASDGTATASFVKDWATVSPGQSAVFYDMSNQTVLGGGKVVLLAGDSRLQSAPSAQAARLE